jgi:hypothetical protein
MNQASREVLDGRAIPIEVKELKGEPNGTWLRIQKIIDDLGDIPEPAPKKKRRPVQKGDGKTIHRSTKRALATLTARIEHADDVDALPLFFGAVRLTQAFQNNGSLPPAAAEDAIEKMRAAAIGSGGEPGDVPETERQARDTDERAGPPMPRGCASAIQAVLDQVQNIASLHEAIHQMRGLIHSGIISKDLAVKLLKRAVEKAGMGHHYV